MDIKFLQDDYENYLSKKHVYSNTRIRPDDQLFMDAMLSFGFSDSPEGQQIIKQLQKQQEEHGQ